MKQKKWMLCLLMLTLILGQLAGCQKTNQSKKEEVAMGRYKEANVAMPEGVESGKEIAYYLTVNPEHRFEVYAADKQDFSQRCYVRKEDGTWEESIPEWMSKFVGQELISGVTYDTDGNSFSYQKIPSEDGEKDQIYLYKSTNRKSVEKISVDDYKDPVTSYEVPLQITPLSEDMLAVLNYETANIYQDGKNIVSIDTQGHSFTYCNDKLVITDGSKDCIDFINISSGKIENQIDFKNLRNLDATYACDNDGNIYIVTRDGVYRTTETSSTVEEIMEAKLTALNQPSLDIEKIIVLNQNEFYILYCGEGGKRLLKQYLYDESLPTVPDKKLTIVSLYDCDSVRQGIYTFEKMYPDVWVDYQVLLDGADGVQKNDAINKLNTELLAGSGPDILVLDGLPINSYKEKGVLADLSIALKPYLDEKKLLENVVKNTSKENKIYAMPLRIGITYVYGVDEAVQSADSIESLAQYASRQQLPIFPSYAFENQQLAQIMFDYYSYEFIQGKSIDEGRLRDFLDSLKNIADQTQIRPNTMGSAFDFDNSDLLNAIFPQSIYVKQSQLGMITLQDMIYSFEPIFVTDYMNGSCSTIHSQYRPSGLLGINAKSEQQGLAAQFVETMFSLKVQRTYLGEGFPVNIDALKGYEMEDDDHLFINDTYEVGQPKDKSKLQNILDLCTTVDTPIIVDEAMKSMVVEEATSYLNAELSLQEAVDAIVNKVNIYLQE